MPEANPSKPSLSQVLTNIRVGIISTKVLARDHLKAIQESIVDKIIKLEKESEIKF